MRRLATAIIIGLAAVPATAAEVAAWDVSSKLLCKADLLRTCEQAYGTCPLEKSEAVFQIDFPAGRFRAFGAAPQFDEAIVWRKFKSYGMGMKAANFIYLSGGARVMQFGQPVQNSIEGTYIPATFIDGSLQGVTMHFLKCQPEQ